MSLNNNPYPHGNFARTEDYLEELILWASKERDRVPIKEEDGGYQDVIIDNSEENWLTVPEEAISAFIYVEVDEMATNKNKALRYKLNGTTPTYESGIPLGDGDRLELIGKENLNNFQAVSIEEYNVHYLRVQYFKSARITS